MLLGILRLVEVGNLTISLERVVRLHSRSRQGVLTRVFCVVSP